MAGATAESLRCASPGRRFLFRLATVNDDAALRQLLRDSSMDGPVRVTLRREPNYFDAASVDGPKRQTLVAVDSHSQRIAGMGARSVRDRFVDGQATSVGYLSGLRILPEYRGGTLLARGYRELRKLHDDGDCDFYLTTIAEGNQPAWRSLTDQRGGLPAYHPLGRYYSLVLPLQSMARIRRASDVEIRPLRNDQMPTLIDFLQHTGRSRLLFPCYTEVDFQGPMATFKELSPDDILAAWRGSQLLGCLALWDQTGFKQTVVEGYGPAASCARPLYNTIARPLGWPTFPAPGRPLAALTAALPLVAKSDAHVFRQLLAAAGRHARQKHPNVRSLLVGLFERDPLLKTCLRASLFRYVTHVFMVYWNESRFQPLSFADRDLYLELGCL